MPVIYNVTVFVVVACLISLHLRRIAQDLTQATAAVHRGTYEDTKTEEVTFASPSGIKNNNISLSDQDIAVFYNLFVDPAANETEIERVKTLVHEQLGLKQPHHKIFVNSIGMYISSMFDYISDTTLLQHSNEGSEMVTLSSIYDYCRQNPSRQVIYLHSKGSYHPRPENEALRQFLTRGAFSNEASNSDAVDATSQRNCNVVSSRFSATPHPHTSGNMWLAHCSYVQSLIPPHQFTERMEQVERLTRSNSFACIGSRRFATEHWIHSHPSVQPCDLFTGDFFQWGYTGLTDTSGTKEGDFDLQVAPRFTWKATKVGCMHTFGKHLKLSLIHI